MGIATFGRRSARRPPPGPGPCAPPRSSGPTPRRGAGPRRACRRARSSPGTGPCRPGSRQTVSRGSRPRSPGRSARTGRACPSARRGRCRPGRGRSSPGPPARPPRPGPAPPGCHRAEPAGHDHRRLAREAAQRRLVEVVVVAVADEHGIEVREQLGQHVGNLAAHRPEPATQDGIGEDPQVVDLDQDGRVAEKCQAAAAPLPSPPARRPELRATPGRRQRVGRAWSDGATPSPGPLIEG